MTAAYVCVPLDVRCEGHNCRVNGPTCWLETYPGGDLEDTDCTNIVEE